jgi:hypothetical protein
MKSIHLLTLQLCLATVTAAKLNDSNDLLREGRNKKREISPLEKRYLEPANEDNTIQIPDDKCYETFGRKRELPPVESEISTTLFESDDSRIPNNARESSFVGKRELLPLDKSFQLPDDNREGSFTEKRDLEPVNDGNTTQIPDDKRQGSFGIKRPVISDLKPNQNIENITESKLEHYRPGLLKRILSASAEFFISQKQNIIKRTEKYQKRELFNGTTTKFIADLFMAMSITLAVLSLLPSGKFVKEFGFKSYHLGAFLSDLFLVLTMIIGMSANIKDSRPLFAFVLICAMMISFAKSVYYVKMTHKISPKSYIGKYYVHLCVFLGVDHLVMMIAILIRNPDGVKYDFGYIEPTVFLF